MIANNQDDWIGFQPKWEYMGLGADDSPSKTLTDYGKEGWELVSVVRDFQDNGLLFYFKRQLPPEFPIHIHTSLD